MAAPTKKMADHAKNWKPPEARAADKKAAATAKGGPGLYGKRAKG